MDACLVHAMLEMREKTKAEKKQLSNNIRFRNLGVAVFFLYLIHTVSKLSDSFNSINQPY